MVGSWHENQIGLECRADLNYPAETHKILDLTARFFIVLILGEKLWRQSCFDLLQD